MTSRLDTVLSKAAASPAAGLHWAAAAAFSSRDKRIARASWSSSLSPTTEYLSAGADDLAGEDGGEGALGEDAGESRMIGADELEPTKTKQVYDKDDVEWAVRNL